MATLGCLLHRNQPRQRLAHEQFFNMTAHPESNERFPYPNQITEDRRGDPLPLRVGLLTDHPSPHMVAFLDALADRPDCAIEVLYCNRKAPGRRWGAPLGRLPHRFVSGVTLLNDFRINPNIVCTMKKTRADIWVINTCYTSLTTLMAIGWLHQKGIPWIYMNEPPRPRHGALLAIKNPLITYVLKRAWGIIGTGGKAEAMYRELFPKDKPTDTIPYYIDLNPFYEVPLPEPIARQTPVGFVTSGQMIRRKALDILLSACKLLPPNGWQLTLVGEGPLRSKFESEFLNRWDRDRVRFLGQVPYQDRASAFKGEHVFVFPSRWDGWGMVVPEALAAGRPVIASNHVISAHEFIQNGVNGFLIPKEDPPALAEKMRFFITHPESIPAMGSAARHSLVDYQPEIGAERLVIFLSRILRQREPMSVLAKDTFLGQSQTWDCLSIPRDWAPRVRATAREYAKKCAIRLNLKINPRKRADGNRILVYHLVLPEDKNRFKDHLRFLGDHFAICSLAEMREASGGNSNSGGYRVAITFDDGFRVLTRTCLETLQQFGVKATFFVPTGFIELSRDSALAEKFSLRAHHYNLPLEPMQPEDLKLLANLGHEVASHGLSHLSLKNLTQPMAERELTLSKTQITHWTGKEPVGFAYPYGHVVSTLGHPPEWVQTAGYEYAVTLKRGPVEKSSHPFLLPREHVEGNWPWWELSYFLLT
jgi:glycosyltransferase involved in cell wall biosynthesis/peptidoglycan/xylan/chitin deacetylase (PgdA/CDA1 family)